MAERTRLFGFHKVLDTSKSTFKDSIPLPSDVEEITEICAYVKNGTNYLCHGFLSLYNEKTNEQILNTLKVSNDKKHFNYKSVYVVNFPQKNNLNFVFELGRGVDKRSECKLGILIKYKLKD